MKLTFLLFHLSIFGSLRKILAESSSPAPEDTRSKTCWSCETFITVLKGYLTDYTPGKETEQSLVQMCTSFFSYIPFMEKQCKTCVTNDLDLLRKALLHNKTVNSICKEVLKLF